MSDSADEMKSVLNTKSGFRKFLLARAYHKAAKRVYRHVKVAFERDLSYHVSYHFLHSLYRTESLTYFNFIRAHHQNLVGFTCTYRICEPDSIYGSGNVCRTARSLYRCSLCCKDTFPSSLTQDQWVEDAWNEACSRADADPNSLIRQDEKARLVFCLIWHSFTQIFRLNVTAWSFSLTWKQTSNTSWTLCMSLSSVELLTALATMQVAPRRCQMQIALRHCWLRQPSFTKYVSSHHIFSNWTPPHGSQDFNFGGRPRYPYRHPIIQKIINITWFKNNDDIGIVFHKYFNPIPFEAIALAATVVRIEVSRPYPGFWRAVSIVIRSSAALMSGPLAYATSPVGRKCATKPSTFPISTFFVISMLAAHTKRVKILCGEYKTTS